MFNFIEKELRETAQEISNSFATLEGPSVEETILKVLKRRSYRIHTAFEKESAVADLHDYHLISVV